MSEPEDSRPKGRPMDQEKRSAILNAARELFLNDGFAVVSMDSIAKRAGVSKATVYSHFEDKNALFRSVLTAETKDYEPPKPSDRITSAEDFRLRLIGFGISLLKTLTRPGVMELGRLLISEAHHHADLASDFYAKGPGATHNLLAEFLKTASGNRLIACDHPELAADQLLSMWIGQRHLRQQLGLSPPPTEHEITHHVEACVDLVLTALACENLQRRGTK